MGWLETCMLLVIGNLVTVGFLISKHQECASYKEKASYWLMAYNRLSSSYMDLAKEKRNNA